MKKVIALFSLVMVMSLQSGCSNTAHGAGKDLENMGQWMQEKV